VRVSADLDFKQIEETEETFDPEAPVVRSEQRSEEKTKGGYPTPSGIPGVKSNIPPGQAQPESAGSSTFQKSNETINYEINRKTRRIVEPTGRITKLSVAVLLDGSYERVTAADGSEVSQYISRTAEEMKQYESIVKNAVGYDAERGDQVEVANISFQKIGMDEEGIGGWEEVERQKFWSRLIRHGVTVLSLLLFFVFVLRPVVKWLTARREQPGIQGMLPRELKPEVPRLAITEGSPGRQKLVEMVTADSERFARLVDAWLK
jgi:flagellar M-ring protein FliF